MSVVGQLTASGAGAGGVAVGVGGSGGSGGTGGAVDARIEGNVHTRGAQSMGVVAQSLGGGGGNGGLAVSGVLTASGRRAARWRVGVGGSGGDGGASDARRRRSHRQRDHRTRELHRIPGAVAGWRRRQRRHVRFLRP